MNESQYAEFPEMAMLQGMTEQQRMLFLAQYHAAKKDTVIGVVLAVFLGHFGVHKFYLGENGWGVVYLLFCWTGIPTILGWIEAFFMPERVRQYNAAHAMALAAQVRTMPGAPPVGGVVPLGAS